MSAELRDKYGNDFKQAASFGSADDRYLNRNVFITHDILPQFFRYRAAGAILLMGLMPLDPLCFCWIPEHGICCVPFFVHNIVLIVI
ncbi:hypothetical protein AAFN85_03065 [Mucilaginibacter sp. CAU 1740]|uniref:hypothetical protein n=1 Tax=Mucilaginibacter sp. CAU 1740 TaxID=3140365 RepID=UPI00325BE58C